ncbi:MAG TPA: saccharopine dehydrogenase NADP-binding domain-containing protein [Acidimicrobiia bacterium]
MGSIWRRGEPPTVFFSPTMKTAAQASARVNQLSGREVAFPRQVDVGDSQLMAETLASVDVVVCAVPYSKILTCTRAAIEAGTSMVDLGGHTETVLQQLELDGSATTAGATIVRDSDRARSVDHVHLIQEVEMSYPIILGYDGTGDGRQAPDR